MGAHSVEHLCFEAAFPTAEAAREQHESFGDLARGRAIRVIGEVFDEVATSDDEVLGFDVLAIDLGHVDLADEAAVESRLREALRRALRAAMAEAPADALVSAPAEAPPAPDAPGDSPVRRTPRTDDELALVRQHLRTGRGPWQAALQAPAAFEAMVLRVVRQRPEAILDDLGASPDIEAAFVRIAGQWPLEAQILLAQAILGRATSSPPRATDLSSLPEAERGARLTALWREVVAARVKPAPTPVTPKGPPPIAPSRIDVLLDAPAADVRARVRAALRAPAVARDLLPAMSRAHWERLLLSWMAPDEARAIAEAVADTGRWRLGADLPTERLADALGAALFDYLAQEGSAPSLGGALDRLAVARSRLDGLALDQVRSAAIRLGTGRGPAATAQDDADAADTAHDAMARRRQAMEAQLRNARVDPVLWRAIVDREPGWLADALRRHGRLAVWRSVFARRLPDDMLPEVLALWLAPRDAAALRVAPPGGLRSAILDELLLWEGPIGLDGLLAAAVARQAVWSDGVADQAVEAYLLRGVAGQAGLDRLAPTRPPLRAVSRSPTPDPSAAEPPLLRRQLSEAFDGPPAPGLAALIARGLVEDRAWVMAELARPDASQLYARLVQALTPAQRLDLLAAAATPPALRLVFEIASEVDGDDSVALWRVVFEAILPGVAGSDAAPDGLAARLLASLSPAARERAEATRRRDGEGPLVPEGPSAAGRPDDDVPNAPPRLGAWLEGLPARLAPAVRRLLAERLAVADDELSTRRLRDLMRRLLPDAATAALALADLLVSATAGDDAEPLRSGRQAADFVRRELFTEGRQFDPEAFARRWAQTRRVGGHDLQPAADRLDALAARLPSAVEPPPGAPPPTQTVITGQPPRVAAALAALQVAGRAASRGASDPDTAVVRRTIAETSRDPTTDAEPAGPALSRADDARPKGDKPATTAAHPDPRRPETQVTEPAADAEPADPRRRLAEITDEAPDPQHAVASRPPEIADPTPNAELADAGPQPADVIQPATDAVLTARARGDPEGSVPVADAKSADGATTAETQLRAALTAAAVALKTQTSPLSPADAARGPDPIPSAPAGAIYVGNAGLVLAGPYFPLLFERLDLVRSGRFVSDAASERAVHLVQYLVDGAEPAPEHLLALNKLVCGRPLEAPIVRSFRVTDIERETIEGLLAAMIERWSILGRTSIAGLRESFLQREGALTITDETANLLVEPRSFDMLLDQIPWGFSTLRHPWMDRVLHVEWR